MPVRRNQCKIDRKLCRKACYRVLTRTRAGETRDLSIAMYLCLQARIHTSGIAEQNRCQRCVILQLHGVEKLLV